MVSTTHEHRNLSQLTLYVETPTVASTYHPLPPLKISLAAVNRGLGGPTDAPYLLLCTVFITAIPLSAMYLLTHRGEIEREVTGMLQLSPLLQGGLKIPGYITLNGKQGSHQAFTVADSGAVRGVQMHPPLAASNVFLRT